METIDVVLPSGLRLEGVPQDLTDAQIKEQAIKQGLATEKDFEGDAFSFSEMVSNIPGSFGNLVGNIATAVANPIDTAKGIGRLYAEAGRGMLQSAEGKANWDKLFGTTPETPSFKAAANALSGRYGSVDNTLNSIEQDPVGVLADVSGLLAGAGRIGGIRSLERAGMVADPINLAVNTGKAGVNALIPKALPAKMYESAAKFSTTFTPDKRQRMAQTALDNKLMPTYKGTAALDGIMDGLNGELNALIQQADAAGTRIPKAAIYTKLANARRQLGGPRIEAANDLRRVDQIVKKFDEHLKAIGKETLTPSELQQFKIDAYKKIKWEPGKATISDAKQKTYKAMALAAKQAIEKAAPQTKDINQQLGRLYELQEPLARAAARIDNHNLLSINAPLNIGAGGAVGGGAGATAGAAMSLMENPLIKSRAAIALQGLKNQGLLGGYAVNSPSAFWVRQLLENAGPITSEF